MYKVHVWRIHSEPKHELKEAESGIPRDGAQRVIYFALATDRKTAAHFYVTLI